MTSDVAVELRLLRAEVAALRDALLPRRALCGADAAWLAAFLPAAAAVMGDRLWLVAELAAVALRADSGPLAATLMPAGGASLRQFGKRLARCAGHPLDGLVLQRVGDSSAGVVWSITETPETPAANGVRSQARR